MIWEVIINERSSLKEYRLIDQNDCKVTIKYNPLHRSARISSGEYHRLFFFESAGSLSGKIIFTNEYGMEVGNLFHDKFHTKEGSLVIDNKKYDYQLQNESLDQLVIYDGILKTELANCSIPNNNINQSNTFSASVEAVENNCFLLGICWYLYLPVATSPVNNASV